jgi:hypothetical protein
MMLVEIMLLRRRKREGDENGESEKPRQDIERAQKLPIQETSTAWE